jgi:hypothetical protein
MPIDVTRLHQFLLLKFFLPMSLILALLDKGGKSEGHSNLRAPPRSHRQRAGSVSEIIFSGGIVTGLGAVGSQGFETSFDRGDHEQVSTQQPQLSQ